jgi:hypothetical protein
LQELENCRDEQLLLWCCSELRVWLSCLLRMKVEKKTLLLKHVSID